MSTGNIAKIKNVKCEEKAMWVQYSLKVSSLDQYGTLRSVQEIYLPITYYWTVPVILDQSCPVGKLKSSKIDDTKVSGF